jgi:hypothetical protein
VGDPRAAGHRPDRLPLIARFIDEQPEFLFVPPPEVQDVAAATGAVPSTSPVSN